MPIKSRDEAKRELLGLAPKVPEHIIDLLLDVHERDPGFFEKQMRDIVRDEKKGKKESKPEQSKAGVIPSIEVDNVVSIEHRACGTLRVPEEIPAIA